MKLKSTQKLIFTLNKSLTECSFDKEVDVKLRLSGRLLGKKENNNEFEPVQLDYKPESINELKYLYHIKILGPGLKYEHLVYARATWLQHIQIWFVNRFMRFIVNFENIFKILTIASFSIPVLMNNETKVNVYVTNPPAGTIVNDTIYSDTIMKDTLHLKDTISVKTK